MKITKSQLKAIIKEEALKFKRAVELKKELSEIEKQLNEVKAGEVMAKDGVHAGQKKPVFASKGNPNLKMEDGLDNDGDEGMDMPDDANVTADLSVDADVPAGAIGGDSITISKAEVLDAIANLAKAGLDGAAVTAELPGEEAGDEEEFEFDTDAELKGDEAGEEVASEEGEEEEIKEYGDEHPVAVKDAVKAMPVGEKSAEVKEEDTVKENLDEPIEGSSPAQEAKEAKESAPFDEKVKNIKESTEVKVEEVKETIAEAEKKRMAFLAGILKG
jgi:hypothetical protein